MNKELALLLCIGLLAGAALSCTISVPTLSVGPVQETSHTLGIEDASSADIQLSIGAGELTVSPNADGLLNATFRYNVQEWQPKVERNNVGSLASVLIQQGSDKNTWGIAGSGARNEWDIRLGNSLPMRLTIGVGAGSSKLDLSGVRLSRLRLDGGAGDMTLRFDTPNPEALSEIQINSGAGKVDLQGMGNANFEQFSFKGGAGQVSLDFNGAWTRSATVDVISGVGQVTVRVPREIGVRVKTSGSPVGKLVVEGLKSVGDGYVNDVYDSAEIKLDISLTTGVGEVTVTDR